MSDKSKDELEDRVAELEATVQKMLPNRRQALKGMAGAAGFTALGFSAGNASAQADTSDGDGNVGLPNERVDVFADGVDANTYGDVNADSLEADTLNNADLANASANTVPTAQGDGTLSMGEVSGSSWDLLAEFDESSDTIQVSVDQSYQLYRLIVTEVHLSESTQLKMRINGATSDYTHWDEEGSETSSASDIPIWSENFPSGSSYPASGIIRLNKTESTGVVGVDLSSWQNWNGSGGTVGGSVDISFANVSELSLFPESGTATVTGAGFVEGIK